MIRPFAAFGCLLFLLGQALAFGQQQPMSRGKTVSQWVELLKSGTPEDKADAAWTLAGMGHAARTAAPALLEAVKDKEWRVRCGAAIALSKVAPKADSSLRALAEAIKDDNWEVRHAVVESLGTIGGDGAFPALRAALADENYNVRAVAMRELGKIGPDTKGVVTALTEVLEERRRASYRERLDAVALLRKFGPRANEAVPVLLAALKSPDEWGGFRTDVAEALWRIERHSSAIPALAKVLRDKSLSERGSAARALCRIGRAGASALATALLDDDPVVRYEAASALMNIGPVGRQAIPALEIALKDKQSAYVRVGAACALWRLDKQPGSIPVLIEGLAHNGARDPARGIYRASARDLAVRMLEEMGPQAKAAIPALAQILGDQGWKERSGAISALEAMGPEAKAAISALIEALKDPDRFVRFKAVELLGSMGAAAKAAVPNLTDLLKDKLPYDRICVATALWRIDKHFAAIPALIELLDDEELLHEENDVTRRTAVRALGEIGPEARAAVPVLVRKLKDRGALMRAQAATALGKMGVEARSASATLLSLLKDPSPYARHEAAVALWLIDKRPDGISVVIQELRDTNLNGREGTIGILARMKPPTKTVIGALAEALNDNDDSVRAAAARVLWRLEKHPAAVPTLIKMLDGDARDRSLAAKVIDELGPDAKDAVPALMASLRDKHSPIHREVCIALGRIGPDAKAAVPAMLNVLADRREEDHHAAIEGLGLIGREATAAVPALIEALNDSDLRVRAEAARALMRIDSQEAAKAGVK